MGIHANPRLEDEIRGGAQGEGGFAQSLSGSPPSNPRPVHRAAAQPLTTLFAPRAGAGLHAMARPLQPQAADGPSRAQDKKTGGNR
jgi:hypothetical protein